jgi:hypothetical protein
MTNRKNATISNDDNMTTIGYLGIVLEYPGGVGYRTAHRDILTDDEMDAEIAAKIEPDFPVLRNDSMSKLEYFLARAYVEKRYMEAMAYAIVMVRRIGTAGFILYGKLDAAGRPIPSQFTVANCNPGVTIAEARKNIQTTVGTFDSINGKKKDAPRLEIRSPDGTLVAVMVI